MSGAFTSSSRRLAAIRRHLASQATQAGQKVAIVVGVGPRQGLGGAIAFRISREGYHVFMMGRTAGKMQETADAIQKAGGKCTMIVMSSIGASAGFAQAEHDQALMEKEVIACFDQACAAGKLEIVVQNQGPNMPPPSGRDMRDMPLAFVQYMWDMNMGISFLVGREAARRIVDTKGKEAYDIAKGPLGTVIFTGATGGMRGKPPFIAFAQAKAGVRYLAQSMAREYGPRGLHVAHVVIDGGVDGDRLKELIKAPPSDKGRISVDSTAETMWALHKQDPSAWTQELEVRPFAENW